MLFVWIILGLIVLSAILIKITLNGFKNKIRTHHQTPKEFDIEFEEINIPTKNSKKMYGWWMFAGDKSPTIILMHGWGRNVGKVLPYIKNLHDKGYNLLAFDSRNHGHSDRDEPSTMVMFAEDISASIDFIMNNLKVQNQEIGIVGLSIGGAAAIYGSSLDDRIKAAVTVGAFANPFEIMQLQMKNYHVPKFISKYILRYVEYTIGFRFDDVAPENNIVKSNTKFFLIHGKHDETIPFSHLIKLKANAVGRNTETWEIPEKGHSDCHYEAGYWERLDKFFKTNLSS